MNARKTVMRSVAFTAMAVAVFSGILGTLALFISVVPEWEKGLARFQIASLILFLVSVSLYAVCAGIVRSGEAPRKGSKAKTICVRVAFYLLFLLGPLFLTVGHSYYVKAKERASQQDMLLARDGYYENPYWEKQQLCDFLGIASLGSWCAWIGSAFLFKVAGSIAGKCRKPTAGIEKK